MKFAVLSALLVLAGWLNNASAQMGYNCTETWLPHSNTCSTHLWDGYCCEHHCWNHCHADCNPTANCGCEPQANCGCGGSTEMMPTIEGTLERMPIESAPIQSTVPATPTKPATMAPKMTKSGDNYPWPAASKPYSQ